MRAGAAQEPCGTTAAGCGCRTWMIGVGVRQPVRGLHVHRSSSGRVGPSLYDTRVHGDALYCTDDDTTTTGHCVRTQELSSRLLRGGALEGKHREGIKCTPGPAPPIYAAVCAWYEYAHGYLCRPHARRHGDPACRHAPCTHIVHRWRGRASSRGGSSICGGAASSSRLRAARAASIRPSRGRPSLR